MKSPAVTRLGRNVRRTGDIIAVLAKYGLADWVKGLDLPWIRDRLRSVDDRHIPDLKTEERVRLACTELGTTFIKLGQMLSTRPDLVGPEMAAELGHLQVAVPADSPTTVQATILAEFGKPSSAVFAYFEEQPLASASIAQVHIARLLTGEDVVVKVQRAGTPCTVYAPVVSTVAPKRVASTLTFAPTRGAFDPDSTTRPVIVPAKADPPLVNANTTKRIRIRMVHMTLNKYSSSSCPANGLSADILFTETY